MTGRPRRRPPNLLIVGVDSLRADHLSSYGYPRPTSPSLDRLATQGVLFERSYSPAIPTTPAFASLLTGMDVLSTRMVALQPKEPLPAQVRTLPELLRERGYVSACVGFDGQLTQWLRGFDQYLTFRAWTSWAERPAEKAARLNEQAFPLVEEYARTDQPFLLLLRYMDPHSPYLPPPPYDRVFYRGDETDPAHLMTERSMAPVFAFAPFGEFFRSWMPPDLTDQEYVVAQYDGAVAYMDAHIGRLVTRLEELGIADETIVVVTADHGESLTEHECYFDHHGLYEPSIHVPLIIRAPGRLPAGQRVGGDVTSYDVVPTLLDLLGEHTLLDVGEFDGRSTLPLLCGERETNHTALYLTECTWMRKRGWRTPEWKLIEALEPDFHGKPPIELYHLADDPGERQNVAEAAPAVVRRLQEGMRAWIDRRVRETGAPDPIEEYRLGTDQRIGPIVSGVSSFVRSLWA
jgi:arylsulfatase A-like enzyme